MLSYLKIEQHKGVKKTKLKTPMNFDVFAVENYLLNERRKNGADFFEVRSFYYVIEALNQVFGFFLAQLLGLFFFQTLEFFFEFQTFLPHFLTFEKI